MKGAVVNMLQEVVSAAALTPCLAEAAFQLQEEAIQRLWVAGGHGRIFL